MLESYNVIMFWCIAGTPTRRCSGESADYYYYYYYYYFYYCYYYKNYGYYYYRVKMHTSAGGCAKPVKGAKGTTTQHSRERAGAKSARNSCLNLGVLNIRGFR